MWWDQCAFEPQAKVYVDLSTNTLSWHGTVSPTGTGLEGLFPRLLIDIFLLNFFRGLASSMILIWGLCFGRIKQNNSKEQKKKSEKRRKLMKPKHKSKNGKRYRKIAGGKITQICLLRFTTPSKHFFIKRYARIFSLKKKKSWLMECLRVGLHDRVHVRHGVLVDNIMETWRQTGGL